MSTFQLPELPYAYDALEPHFDSETMKIHHQRHHQAYVDNLNKALEGSDGEGKSLKEILPEISKYSPATRNKRVGLGQFGSGWSWLFVKYNGSLGITGTANQDNPLMDTQLVSRGFPILGVDVWEHAYYLKYQNKRADYLDAFWSVLNWEVVEENYEAALAEIK